MKELWKPIKGYEERYLISSCGRVKRIARTIPSNFYNCFDRKLPEMILKPRKTKNGYLIISLFNGIFQKNYFIHRLVAEAFINKPEGKNYIDHLDGDKLNNYYKNLEWVSIAENNKRAYDLGLKRRIHAGQFIDGKNRRK